MGARYRSYDIRELDIIAMNYASKQRKRVQNYRLKVHSGKEKKSMKKHKWDMPITVCTCSAFNKYATGRNNPTLQNLNKTINDAYTQINVNDGNEMRHFEILDGQKPCRKLKKLLGLHGKSFERARCAEPHAAHKLLNNLELCDNLKLSKTSISDIVFSHAFNVADNRIKPYCNTCKCAFPQLR